MPDAPIPYRAKGPTHKKLSESSEQRKADKRFYSGKQWRDLREWILNQTPLCSTCYEQGRTTIATDVDHVIDRKDAPELAYEASNLSAKCHSCHSRKTARTKR